MQLADFQAPQDFAERLASTPKVRSPRSTEDIRLRGNWVWDGVLMAKHDNKYFLVQRNLAEVLAGRLFRASLYAMASSNGDICVWPVKLGTSAVDAAKAAIDRWVRITWTNATKSYVIQDAAEQHGDPTWRYPTFDQLVEIAFAGRVLNDPEQPEVKAILAGKASGK